MKHHELDKLKKNELFSVGQRAVADLHGVWGTHENPINEYQYNYIFLEIIYQLSSVGKNTRHPSPHPVFKPHLDHFGPFQFHTFTIYLMFIYTNFYTIIYKNSCLCTSLINIFKINYFKFSLSQYFFVMFFFLQYYTQKFSCYILHYNLFQNLFMINNIKYIHIQFLYHLIKSITLLISLAS